MYTDWLIVRRLAVELDRAVRSARVREAGVTSDGRFALRVRARGAGADALVLDPFAETPVITIEHADRLEPSPGWPRTIADAIRGMRIEAVRSRTGDRLIVVELATLSRFGVLNRCRMVVELVPRFGNIVLVRDDGVVAAAREFTAERNPKRPIIVGGRYAPPPLPEPRSDRPALEQALQRLAEPHGSGEIEAAAGALRASLPLLPRLVATSLVTELAGAPTGNGSLPADRLLDRARTILDGAADLDPRGSVFIYRAGGRIAQMHVVPLAQFANAEADEAADLLPVLEGALAEERSAVTSRRGDQQRTGLLARVERLRRRLATERERLERDLADSESADRLRRQGELLYSHIGEIPNRATSFVAPEAPDEPIELDPELDPKANAAAIFKRYRKAVARKVHVERRLGVNAEAGQAVEELAWEVERAEAAALAELAEELDRLEHPRQSPQAPAAAKPAARSGRARPPSNPRQAALEVALSDDARILVGRSPRNNAELTFKIARPEDLWFHARGVPGAHVVLRIDSSRQASAAELRAAAELAAFHSKGRTSGLVAVDYTQRKNVRKQQNAMPGLVWYTNAKTIDVTPRAAK